MPATVNEKLALTVQTGMSPYTARTNMKTNRKASIIRCVQKGAETTEERGLITIFMMDAKWHKRPLESLAR